jgi:predicted transcriptional regulator
MKIKKALLIVEPTSKAFDRAFKVLARPSRKFVGVTILSFPSFEMLGKVVTGARLELLTAVRKNKPKSIQELARILGRDFKNVYGDVKLLADFGLIDLKERGARKATLPVAKFEELVLAA